GVAIPGVFAGSRNAASPDAPPESRCTNDADRPLALDPKTVRRYLAVAATVGVDATAGGVTDPRRPSASTCSFGRFLSTERSLTLMTVFPSALRMKSRDKWASSAEFVGS